MPSTSMNKERKKYFKNILGQTGKKVGLSFEYTSSNNKDFLDIKKIKNIMKINIEKTYIDRNLWKNNRKVQFFHAILIATMIK